jgi:hypothetical protein
MVCALAAVAPPGWAQAPASPTIHRVVVRADTGVLTIIGTGLGPDLHVTVDGQPVTTLPGATEEQLDVVAPMRVLTEPGTYRLTVIDPVRHAWDGFIVASPPGLLPHAAGAAAAPAAGVAGGWPLARQGTGPEVAIGAAPGTSPSTPGPLIIENSGSPYLTGLGFEVLINNSGGSRNTGVGYQALRENVSGLYNTAVGFSALRQNTSGFGNSALGRDALLSNVDGVGNTAVGNSALRASVSADANVAIGDVALTATTSGYRNVAVGSGALSFNTAGAHSVALGYLALADNTTGNENVGTGASSLENVSTGSANTAIGYRAGASVTTGSHNILIGAQVTGTSTDANTMRIGRPFDGVAGQNATFIAGIRGVTVAGGEVVYIDTNGRLGSGPIVPGPDTVGSPQVLAESLTSADLAPASVASSEIVDGSVTAADLAAGSVGTSEVVDGSLTAADVGAGAVGTSALADDAVTAAKVAFSYAASASEGGAAADLACAGCVAASEVSFTFAGLGGNTFTGTQRIGSGNLELGPSTAMTGNVLKGGASFLHNPGFMNTFLGESAGTPTVTGGTNTAVGGDALRALAAGDANTASGYGALFSNVAGTSNTAHGTQALFFTTGSYNTAVGLNAGAANTSGSHNLYVGADVRGTSADANTMRLGLPFNPSTGEGQNRTFVAGVAGTVLTTPAVQVFVDANGQLGTLTPPPIVGTVTGGVTPGAAPRDDGALLERLAAQDAVIAELRARLVRLEAQIAARPGRR